jgi:hypothetical protein
VPLAPSPQRWSRDTTDVNGSPEWLADIMARDAELQSQSQRNSRWKRGLATGGAAAVLLALLGSGGLWLYQESQVEGTMVVLANTSPAPAVTASRPALALSPQGAPAGAGSGSSAPASRLTDAPGAPGAAGVAGVAAVGATTGGSTAAAAGETPVLAPQAADAGAAEAPAVTPAAPEKPSQAAPAPRRARAHTRKHARTEAKADIPADSGPSARQRHEETLMQCRAHGYDERQCLERGCEMTRYGFACKG